MAEIFSQPDDAGPALASEAQTSLLGRLGAQAADTLDPKDSLSGMFIGRRAREASAGGEDQAIGAGGDIDVFSGQSLEDRQGVIDASRAAIPDISKADAKQLLQQQGLTESDVHLGDQDTHKLPVLQMRIDEAHTRRDREAAIARGPQGFFPGALGLVTSLGVGMIDPINAAAFSIPVIGEARMGKILASAGDSILARGAARFGQGAAQGAVGTAALQPADWWLHTNDGQDYTMAQAMESIIMGAGMGGAFHAIPGGFRDVLARRRGLPLEGSAADQLLRALTTTEPPAATTTDEMSGAEEVPGIGPQFTPREIVTAPHPAEILADLPPAARQDAVHAAMADIIADRPVRSAELLGIAADHDPRIADTMQHWDSASEPLTPEAARDAVFDDVHQQLLATGMGEDEAGYNAAIVAARYATRAERLGNGQNAADLYRAEGVQVRAGEFADAEGRAFQQRSGEGPDLFAQREAEGQTNLPGTERIGQGELAQRKADEALKPKVAQKPMDEGLFGDFAAQKSFFQSQPSAPAFYSALGRAVDLTKQEKASPEQWLGMLKNAASVKPEEMKWLGLEDWLKEQQGSVTKAQLQDFIRANQIEVKEVTKGENVDKPWSQLSPAERQRAAEAFGYKPGVEPEWGSVARWYEDMRAEGDSAISTPTTTKYSGYKLPGGENYREMLLTLPPKSGAEGNAVADFARQMHEKYGDRWVFRATPEEMKHYDDLIETQDKSASQPESQNYKSSHWDEPNILAHVRFDDRVSDGKKTLHVAEVQSDWHQAGKRKGYALPAPAEADIDLKFVPPTVPEGHNPANYPGYWESFDKRTGEMIGRHPGAIDQATAMQEAIDGGADIQRRKIPDAPFKTSWPELAMKRMIRYAAEHGYDRISWDTGATNADRYSLSKQIKSLRWNETTGDLQAKDHSGEVVVRRTASKEELPDIIGKEAAQKLVDQKAVEIKLLPPVHKEYLTVEQTEHQYVVTNVDGRKVNIGKGVVGSEDAAKEYAERHLNNSAKEINQRRELEGQRVGTHRTLEGLDLEVGGEGMKGFYDKILPATVNKLVKKFGAKVQPGEIGSPREFPQYEGAEPTKEQIAQVAEATGARPTDQRFVSPVTGERQMFQINRAAVDHAMLEVRQAMNGGASFAEAMAKHGNHDLAEIFGGKLGQRSAMESDATHAVDITPELRKAAIEQGFPLFQGGEANPRGRITLADNKAIIDLFKAADRSTFMHESGHLWLDELMRDAEHPEASEQLRADRDTVLQWLGVKNASEIGTEQHEKWAEGFEHYLATGNAPSNALGRAFEAFKAWLAEIYRALSNSGQPIPDEIRGVMDRLLATDREIAERDAGRQPLNAAPAVSRPPPAPAKPKRGRAAADPKTWSLFEYLASRGGLKPDADLLSTFGNKRGPFVPGFGPLLRKSGMTMDDALVAAKEAGYFIDPTSQEHVQMRDADMAALQQAPTFGIRELMAKIDEESRGHKQYQEGHVEATRYDPAQESHLVLAELEHELEASGAKVDDIDPKLLDRTVEIVKRDGETDVLAAYERAIMEDAERYDATADERQSQAETSHIPGWDAADVRTAPGDGQGSAGERGQAGRPDQGARGADGAQSRGPGQGNRSSHAVAAADPRWRELADTTPNYNDPETVAESEAAAHLPEPDSLVPERSLTALETAAADAEEVWRKLEPTLTEQERALVNDVMDKLKLDAEARSKVITDGVACLVGAIA